MKKLALKSLERLLNRLIALDPETKARLQALDQKTILIHVEDWTIKIYCTIKHDTLHLADVYEADADAEIHATLNNFLRFTASKAMGENRTTGIQIEGDIDCAQTLQSILQQLDIDWEEELSKCVGDSIAHSAFQLAERVGKQLKHTAHTLHENLYDYLHQETHSALTTEEANEFYLEINTVRDAVERAEARINHLEAKREDCA